MFVHTLFFTLDQFDPYRLAGGSSRSSPPSWGSLPFSWGRGSSPSVWLNQWSPVPTNIADNSTRVRELRGGNWSQPLGSILLYFKRTKRNSWCKQTVVPFLISLPHTAKYEWVKNRRERMKSQVLSLISCSFSAMGSRETARLTTQVITTCTCTYHSESANAIYMKHFLQCSHNSRKRKIAELKRQLEEEQRKLTSALARVCRF